MKKTLLSYVLIGAMGIAGCGEKSCGSNRTAYTAEYRNSGVDAENDFNYHGDDMWFKRLDSLEGLALGRKPITDNTILTLKRIVKGDDDWRIVELTQQMISSYNQQGNFRATDPYLKMQCAQKRKGIETRSSFGYDPADIWYKRLDAVKSLRNAPLTTQHVSDLQVIINGEDNWMVKDEARCIEKQHNAAVHRAPR